jgi:hypothetical protein
VDVVAAEDRLRFRVEGGSAHWAMAIAREHPEMPMPPFSEGGENAAAQLVSDDTLVQKSVLREDGSETNVKKKALIVDPFSFQFGSTVETWKAQLEELHDYERVDYFKDDMIPDVYFANWNDYRFVWVLSHGAYLPDPDDPDYTAIFSAQQCGMNRWLGTEIADGNGGETLRNGQTLGWVFGLPRPQAEALLTADQLSRWRNFRDEEIQMLTDSGRDCGFLDMGSLTVPGQQGLTRAPAFLDFIYYDEAWFSTKYPGGLDEVLVQLSVCSSLAVPNLGGSGSTAAIFGWTEPVGATQDDATTAVLFDRLIERGETASDAFEKLEELGPRSHQWDGKTTELKLSTFSGGERARMREIVTILDPEALGPFPDEGGTIEARELPGDGTTLLDITLLLEGFGKTMPEEFKVQIFDGNDSPISAEWEVDEPTEGSSKTFMTLEATLNQEVTAATEVELEARVTLPEEPGTVYSKHPIKVTVLPAIESAWRFTVGGAGTARGDFINAPSATAFLDDEGRLVWQIGFTQNEGSAELPSAFLYIIDHPGRSTECTGPTGNFNGIFWISYTPQEVFGGGDGDGECGDIVAVGIQSFSKSDDLVGTVNGIICKPEVQGEEVVLVPTPLNGRFAWPAAGCGADPGGGLVKSLVSADQPALCTDVYPNAAIAPAIDMICSQGGITCSDDPCPTDGQIGQCDYRSSATPIGFRGQIQHFGPNPEWPTLPELAQACEMQLGVWTTGTPM